MWGQIASLGLGALASIPQWITGYNQDERADQLSKGLVRPEYVIPESQKRALRSAEEQAKMTRLPGQSAIEGRLDQTTANKIAMIERLGSGGPTSINAASRAYGQQMDAETDLGVQSANMRLRNQDVLRGELGRMAGYEQEKWNWDQRLPYEQKAAAIEALREGGLRNKNAAWNNIFGGAASFFGGLGPENNYDWLGNIFGSTNQPTTPGTPIQGPQGLQYNPVVNPYQPDNFNPSRNPTPGPRSIYESLDLGGIA